MKCHEICLAFAFGVLWTTLTACDNTDETDDSSELGTETATAPDTSDSVGSDTSSNGTDDTHGTDTLDEAACAAEDHPDEVYVPWGPVPTAKDGSYAGGFWIDKYEVSMRRYWACVDAGLCNRPQYNYGDGVTAPPVDDYFDKPSEYPTAGISFDDIVHFCEFDGKILPTAAEADRAIFGDTWQRNALVGGTADGYPTPRDGVNAIIVTRYCDVPPDSTVPEIWVVTRGEGDITHTGIVNTYSNVVEIVWENADSRNMGHSLDGVVKICSTTEDWRTQCSERLCDTIEPLTGMFPPSERVCSGTTDPGVLLPWTGFRCMRPC